MERVLTAKGVATRSRIIAGAAVLIRQEGPANVGLDNIRAVSGTSKSQLFHYFPAGKADLMLAVAAYEAEQVLADQQPMLSDLTTWAKWDVWRVNLIAKYNIQRQRCPFSALTAQLGLADPATRAIINDMYSRWHRYLASGMGALKDSGEIAATVDIGRVATTILATVCGGISMLQATDDITYLETGLTDVLNGWRCHAGIAALKD
ncbi:TetR/AcrR family transcriptional regulator [Streptomyces chartreusis]|uniref:TetR/AcrR family transcriptional regulator n=1 Tax=Streptomyces chartreusis TaxID=1969 RepID=UPI003687B487